MKILLQYVVGAGIGIAFGFLLPLSGGDTLVIVQQLTDLVVRVGRILLFPMAFFSVIIAVDELRDDRQVLPIAVRAVVAMIATVVFAAVLGTVAVTVLQPQRIPPMIQEAVVSSPSSVGVLLQESIPRNGFRAFTLGENALAMILIIGAAIGWTLRHDREITSPVSLVADSANRILYRLNGGITKIVGLLLAIPVGALVVELRLATDLSLFVQLLIVLGTTALVIGGGIYPFLLYLFHRNVEHIGRWMKGMGAPGLAALATGDVYFATATAAYTNKEVLNLPRRVGGSVSYITAVFARPGTVLIAVSGFLVVLRSYIALEIGFSATVEIILTGIAASFLLGRMPIGGVTIVLSYLAIAYGRGMEESYLILLPIIPILERIGAWLDVMTHGFIAFFTAEDTRVLR